MPVDSMAASTVCTGSSISPSSDDRVDAHQLLVERVGEVDDRPGPQDQGLHRLVVDALVIIEQRKLLLLRSIRAQFATQVAKRQVVEGEAALPGPHQVRRQRGVGGDTVQRPAAAGQIVHRQLGLVQRLGFVGVGEPVAECRLVLGVSVAVSR